MTGGKWILVPQRHREMILVALDITERMVKEEDDPERLAEKPQILAKILAAQSAVRLAELVENPEKVSDGTHTGV